MMDDIAEQQDVAREISDAISNPVAFGQDADEDELEKELEELQQEQLDKELLGIDTTTDELPAVPTSVPVAPSKTRTSNYYSSKAHSYCRKIFINLTQSVNKY